MTLMYSFGAHSVKCAVCQFITSVAVWFIFSIFARVSSVSNFLVFQGGPNRVPLPMQRPPYPGAQPPPSQPPQSQAGAQFSYCLKCNHKAHVFDLIFRPLQIADHKQW